MKIYRFVVIILAFALFLSACNLPTAKATEQVNPNAIFTAAAQTVVVQLTQNALLNPPKPVDTVAPPVVTLPFPTEIPIPPAEPTNTPTAPLIPTATTAPAIPTVACDLAQFVTDVTIPDGTLLVAGSSFVKTWRLKNIGTCTWNTSYSLVLDSGEKLGGPASQTLTVSTAPGATLDVSVNLQAPASNGSYRGFWGMTNSAGARIPVVGGFNQKTFSVDVKVGSGSSGTETAGKFAITSVSFSVSRSGACDSPSGKYVINATVVANKAGTMTYNWVFGDGGTVDPGSIVFDGAGSKVITYQWSTMASGLWVDLYVDKPNHQQFGRAVLNCP